MKENVMLTGASLLSVVLGTFHLTRDLLRNGMTPVGFYTSVLIMVVWVYGTLVLAERRSGYIILILGSLLGLAVPGGHMMGAGIAKWTGFFFVWTMMALAVSASFSLILSVRGLWRLQRGKPGSPTTR